jgi:hypothetical protein
MQRFRRAKNLQKFGPYPSAVGPLSPDDEAVAALETIAQRRRISFR